MNLWGLVNPAFQDLNKPTVIVPTHTNTERQIKMSNDYLGIELEKEIEIDIENGRFYKLENKFQEALGKVRNPSFHFWKLLYEKREADAIECKHNNVMVRNSKLGLYIAYKRGQDKAFSLLISSEISGLSKKNLLSSALLWACKLNDPNFALKTLGHSIHNLASYNSNLPMRIAAEHGALEVAQVLVKHGANKGVGQEYPLKKALELEDKKLIKFFIHQADLNCIGPRYVEENLAKKGKVQAIKALCEKQASSVHANCAILKQLYQAIKEERPETLHKEMLDIFSWYPHQEIRYLESDHQLGEFARLDKKRRTHLKIARVFRDKQANDLCI